LRARQELRDGLLGAIRDAARACEHARRIQGKAEIGSVNCGVFEIYHVDFARPGLA
jgi:hypothetical protein